MEPETETVTDAKSEAQPEADSETKSTVSKASSDTEKPEEGSGQDNDGSVAVAGSLAADTPADSKEILGRVIEEISRRRQSLAAHIGGIENLALSDGDVHIFEDPNDNNWLKKALNRGKNRAILEESLVAVLGEGARWRLLEVERSTTPVVPAEDEKASDPLLSHPRVQAALDIFGGTAHTAESEET